MTSPKTIAIGGAAGLVAIAAASWFLVLGPQRAEADQIRADTDAIQASTELLEQQISDLEEIRDSLPERLAELEQLTEGFPRKAEIRPYSTSCARLRRTRPSPYRRSRPSRR